MAFYSHLVHISAQDFMGSECQRRHISFLKKKNEEEMLTHHDIMVTLIEL